MEENRIEKNSIEYLCFLQPFFTWYALMNSFYITCTLAALQRKRGKPHLSFEKADSNPPPPPPPPQKRESTRKKVGVSAPIL